MTCEILHDSQHKHLASQEGHTSTVDVLLRNGADPNVAKNVRVVHVIMFL